MNAVLYSANPALLDLLISKLLTFGVEVKVAGKPGEILSNIKVQESDCVLIDIEAENQDWFSIIQKIKSDQDTTNTAILLFSKSQDKEYINSFIKQGINAVFDTNNPISAYSDRLYTVIKALEENTENKRKYVRVQPSEDEEVNVKIAIHGQSELVQAHLRDLSVVACAVTLDFNNDVSAFNEVKVLEKVQIFFPSKMVYSKGSILRTGGNIIVIGFLKPSDTFSLGVTEYIYEKIHS